ncbi:MAG TPA: orotate phosphoribosyltransferase [Acidimicrobiales bacterium]|nr:orotate phosphoribosyltransferase [Acidimicrobiales bacterium]
MTTAADATPDATTRALIDHLLRHAVRRGDFVLKSGKRSGWFIDAKQTTCRPDGMLLVADAMLAVLPDEVTAIGGLTMGADAAAFGTAAVAATRGRALRSFSVRKEAKHHGGGGRIAGALEPGDRVALTEDAATRGVSMLEAAEVVRAAGAEPVILVPVVDRGGTCEALAAEAGITYCPLVTAPDLGFPYERDVP